MSQEDFNKKVLPYVLDNLYRDNEVQRVIKNGKTHWSLK